MTLAFRDLWRNRRRFGAILAALALINVLLLFFVSQLDGLIDGQTNALTNSGVALVSYQKGVDDSLFRSSIPLTTVDTARGVAGVQDAGGIGVLFGAGRNERSGTSTFDLGLFGFQPGRPGTPRQVVEGRLPNAGESGAGAIDVSAKDKGVRLGDTIRFADDAGPIRIVGFVQRATLQLQPALWVDMGMWHGVRDRVRPERTGTAPDANVLLTTLAKGADSASVARALDGPAAGSSAGLHTLDLRAAIDTLPGVSAQRQTFVLIIGLTYVATAIVVFLFFVLATLEKTALIGVLKAIGARTSYLAGFVCAQGAVLGAVAFALGVAVTSAFTIVLPSAVPFRVAAVSWLTIGGVTIGVSVLATVLTLRRLTGIDPARAIGGGDQ